MTHSMFSRLKQRIKRFRAEQDGSQTVEFITVLPFYFFFLFWGVEVGLSTLKNTELERALDMTVRDIRLGTGAAFQHDDIKDAICDRMAIAKNCEQNLQLEMITRDLRNWSAPPADANCIDHAEESNPVRAFNNGGDNQLMILRACLKYKPVLPWTDMAEIMEANGDSSGYSRMIASSAFVQEPR